MTQQMKEDAFFEAYARLGWELPAILRDWDMIDTTYRARFVEYLLVLLVQRTTVLSDAWMTVDFRTATTELGPTDVVLQENSARILATMGFHIDRLWHL